jgi:hypothetical protein
MKSKNNDWIWIILFAIIGLLIFFSFSHYFSSDIKSPTSAKKSKRLSDLRNEKNILESHINKIKVLQDKIKRESDKVWKKLLKLIIIIFICLNGIILGLFYLITGVLIFSDVITFYTLFYFCFNILFLFFTYKTFSYKAFLYDWLQEYSYKKVAASRDAEYYVTKSETIQNRIEQIELEIKQLESIIPDKFEK